jgi:hypothetical protein
MPALTALVNGAILGAALAAAVWLALRLTPRPWPRAPSATRSSSPTGSRMN